MFNKILFLLISSMVFQYCLSQSCTQTSTEITVPCRQNCVTLTTKIPNVRQSSNYSLVSGAYLPYPYQCPGDTALTSINIDDKFSAIINLPFSVCFYGQTYNQAVVGSNGILTFDVANANCSNAYVLQRAGSAVPIPDNGGTICAGIGTVYYPKASIMAPYHDIDPNAATAISAGRRIAYYYTGIAPARKMVVNFYHVPMFNCTAQICDEQIVIYESTGLIDVNIGNKPLCTTWNGGLATLGIQNFTRDMALAAPGKNCTQWSSSNETYRFIPSEGTPLFRKVELYLGNNLIAVGDTVNNGNGEYDVSFPNTCFSGDTATYRIVSTYASCFDPNVPAVIESFITVRHGNTLNINALIQPGNCALGGNQVTITSPVGPGFEYSIDGVTWQSSPIIIVPGGPQTIRVRNATECGSRNYTLPFFETVRASVNASNTKCYGSSDGSIFITTLAGLAPFQFSADGGANYQSSGFFSRPAGTYNIRIADANNCFKDTAITIGQPDSIAIATTVNAAFCSGLADGQIITTASGGSPAYQYSLTNANYQTSNTLAANVGNNFIVYVKDANNCVDSLVGIIVPLNDTMRLTPMADTSVCQGSAVTLQPITNATQFLWSPATHLNSTNIRNPTAMPVDTITYYLDAKLGMLCSRQDTVVVRVLKLPIANAGNDTIICYATKAQLNATAIRGNIYKWTPTTGLSNAEIQNPIVNNLNTTVYTVEVTDPYNCGFKVYDSVTVLVRPKVRAFAGQDTTATLGTPVQLFGCCMDIYQWQPPGIFVSDTARNPIGNFAAGTTQVIMLTTTPEGCKGYDTLLVKAYIGPTYYVPGGFSPGNKDGKNDVFRPIPVGIEETFYFSVYNRFGQLIYTTKTFLAGWDGTYQGILQPEGAYVWMVKGRSFEGKIVEQKGTVLLLRN